MSCTLRGCSFGKIKEKNNSDIGYIKGLKNRSRKRRNRRKSNSKSRSWKRSHKKKNRKRSRRRSRRFGFKYLRNDQIINSVFHNYPANLTCDRA